MDEPAQKPAAHDDPGKRKSLDQIAESFVARLRQGEHPSVNEYAERYPEIAEEIREVLPTLVALEKFGPGNDSDSVAAPTSLFNSPKQMGEYTVVRELGRGGMGVVYEATHNKMRRRVALKVLPSGISENGLKRFMREARAAGQLHHTNIVPVFEIGQQDNIHFYAMQYIHGQNLDIVIDELRYLQNENRESTRMELRDQVTVQRTLSRSVAANLFRDPEITVNRARPATEVEIEPVPETPNFESNGIKLQQPDQRSAPLKFDVDSSTHISSVGQEKEGYYQRVARIGVQVADALDYAHQHGVVHRDIKPSNLILDTDGIVWVTDFGLAKEAGDDLTHTGDIVGTLRYMAPERFKRAADVRSDIYSLGLTLYELCTLTHAYDQKDRAQLMQQLANSDPLAPRKVRRDIPKDLETIILKAIERQPKARYQTAKQLSDDLELFLSDRPIRARRISATERFWRMCRRNPIAATLTACIAALMIIVVAGSLRFAFLTQQHAKVVEKQSEELDRSSQELMIETKRAKKAEQEARKKTHISESHLFVSYRDQAISKRSSGQVGRQFESLKLIQRAAETLRSIPLTKESIAYQTNSLRNEAIASMTMLDLEQIQHKKFEQDWTSAVAIHYESNRYAVADENGNICVDSFKSSSNRVELPSPGERAWVIRISPDGNYLCAKYHHSQKSNQPIVCLWSTDGELIGRWENGLNRACFGFSNNSQKLVVAQKNGEFNVYRTETGQLIRKITTPKEAHFVEFGFGDSKLVTAVREDLQVIFYDLENGTPTQNVSTGVHHIKSFDWCDRSRGFVVGTDQENVFVWFENKPEQLLHIPTQHRARIVRCFLSPDGRFVMTTAWDGTTRLIDVERGKEVLQLIGLHTTYTPFDQTGKKIALSGNGTSQFGVWQLPTRMAVKKMNTSKERVTRYASAFHPKYPRLLFTTSAEGIEVWDTESRQLVCLLDSGPVDPIVFSETGERLYVGGDRGIVRWDIELDTSRQKPVLRFLKQTTLFSKRVSSLRINESLGIMVAKPRGDYGLVLDLESGAEKVRFGRHIWMSDLVLSPGGETVVSTTWQGFGIYVWDTKTGKLLRKIAPEWSTSNVAFHPNQPMMIAVSGLKRRIYDTQSWDPIEEIDSSSGDDWVSPIVFSNTGSFCVTGQSRYVTQMIDPQQGTSVVRMQLPELVATGALAISRNERFVATADGYSVYVWDLVTLQQNLDPFGLQIDSTYVAAKKNGDGPLPHDKRAIEVEIRGPATEAAVKD